MIIVRPKKSTKTVVYDKASWHIDAGEPKYQVLKHFQFFMKWSKDNNILTDEGLEIYNLGVDDSISLHSRMFTELGNIFMNSYYDDFINVVDDRGNKMKTTLNSIKIK